MPYAVVVMEHYTAERGQRLYGTAYRGSLAAAVYKSVFLNAKVEAVSDFMATFELEGQKFHALNGGLKLKFAVSFFASVDKQEEDHWNGLLADGGWATRRRYENLRVQAT